MRLSDFRCPDVFLLLDHSIGTRPPCERSSIQQALGSLFACCQLQSCIAQRGVLRPCPARALIRLLGVFSAVDQEYSKDPLVLTYYRAWVAGIADILPLPRTTIPIISNRTPRFVLLANVFFFPLVFRPAFQGSMIPSRGCRNHCAYATNSAAASITLKSRIICRL